MAEKEEPKIERTNQRVVCGGKEEPEIERTNQRAEFGGKEEPKIERTNQRAEFKMALIILTIASALRTDKSTSAFYIGPVAKHAPLCFFPA